MDERGSNVIPFPSRRWPGASGISRRGEHLTRRAERRATMLFAELRGWRTITEAAGPAEAETLLAHVVDRALETLIEFEAYDVTLDGEPVQPVVSATFEGPGHALRALRAACAIRSAVADAQEPAPPGRQFQVCTGVNSGDIVDLALGDEDPVSFQSVGTLRSFAVRLQEFAGPGQVLLSAGTFADVRQEVSVRSVGDLRMNAHGEKQEAFALTDVVPETRVGDPGR